MSAMFSGIDLATIAARLLDRCMPIPGCGCYIWMGGLSGNGYARVWVPETGRMETGHIITYRGLIGTYDPALLLDHTCRVRMCIWPWHLEPVTHAVNTRRGLAVLFSKGESYAINNT